MLGANKYAQVLRSREGCAKYRKSPTSRNHLRWSVTGWHLPWIQGERVVREVNDHVKARPWPRAEH